MSSAAFLDGSVVHPSENHCLDDGLLESRKCGKVFGNVGRDVQLFVAGEVNRGDANKLRLLPSNPFDVIHATNLPFLS